MRGGGSLSLKRLKKTLAKYLYLYEEFQNFLEDFEIKFLVINKEVIESSCLLASECELSRTTP
ncbi:MAG: hypothetical protein SCAL_001109 [Candidatus Syntrophoarchaeum caldarius]|uniref:Uncharacterized protein n=1 Tax=Candidatus Syntropharchaeum caldarium TaxID=1838285 RepID=A0A1F2P9G1_9EURY|nr:MAG: hypothetical protein SCAL_001109 [Candidatus Syntrophoarchaeum caldarius]